jgi:hypothetical protein
MSAERTALAQLVRKATGRVVELREFGPALSGYAMGRIDDYPASGQTTALTSGVARQAVSRWRGLPLGHELVLTMDGDVAEVLAMVEAAVLENHSRRSDAVDRRPFVAANGVWAPGYAPHLVFTDEASATPELMVQKKLGDRYVSFLSVVPIDDRELREYDRNPGAFIAQLAAGGRVSTYPRPLP